MSKKIKLNIIWKYKNHKILSIIIVIIITVIIITLIIVIVIIVFVVVVVVMVTVTRFTRVFSCHSTEILNEIFINKTWHLNYKHKRKKNNYYNNKYIFQWPLQLNKMCSISQSR